MSDDKQCITVLIARFNTYKAEIEARSQRQLLIHTACITAIVTIAGFYLANRADIRVLFLQGIAGPIFSFAYVDHYLMIRRIGSFLQNILNPAIHDTVNRKLPDYEVYSHPFAATKGRRFFIFVLPLLLPFWIIPALCTLFVYLIVPDTQRDVPFWVGLGLSSVLLLVSAIIWWPVITRSAKLEEITKVSTNSRVG